MDLNYRLQIKGRTRYPASFTFADLTKLPNQISDIGKFITKRQGEGVFLKDILKQVNVHKDATHITIESTDKKFFASVELQDVNNAILVYKLGDNFLPEELGGPVRFFIPDVDKCGTGNIDKCANVKYVGCLTITNGPGKDNRPTTKKAHMDLHKNELTQ